MPEKRAAKFTGKKKEFFLSLMEARAIVLNQMNFHKDEALGEDATEKRGMTTHMADLGSDNSRHEMELQLLSEEGDVLELIEEAIQRLENNEYGICQDCNEMISESRLEQKPHALYCVKCKGIREKNGGYNPYVD